MIANVLSARGLVAMVVAAVVGTWGVSTHPVDTENPLMKGLAKIIVRGGFFVLLIGSMLGLGYIFRRAFPAFPPGCRTVGQLGAFLSAKEETGGEAWTKEAVWCEVRGIVARTLRVRTEDVVASTKCE